MNVILHGAFYDSEPGGDRLVGQASGDFECDHALARGERAPGGWTLEGPIRGDNDDCGVACSRNGRSRAFGQLTLQRDKSLERDAARCAAGNRSCKRYQRIVIGSIETR